jgi:hypothetical protein
VGENPIKDNCLTQTDRSKNRIRIYITLPAAKLAKSGVTAEEKSRSRGTNPSLRNNKLYKRQNWIIIPIENAKATEETGQ